MNPIVSPHAGVLITNDCDYLGLSHMQVQCSDSDACEEDVSYSVSDEIILTFVVDQMECSHLI